MDSSEYAFQLTAEGAIRDGKNVLFSFNIKDPFPFKTSDASSPSLLRLSSPIGALKRIAKRYDDGPQMQWPQDDRERRRSPRCGFE